MDAGNAILCDLTAFRAELQERHAPYQPLLKLSVWKPLRDIAMDQLLIGLAVLVVMRWGWWVSPLAAFVIGNRQRALGNILHDAAHRNLHRTRHVNDTIAILLVAPMVFSDLASYRDTHFRHHMQLGTLGADPDYIPCLEGRAATPCQNYVRCVLSLRIWWSSLAGDLGSHTVGWTRKLYIVMWWAVVCSVMGVVAGFDVVLTFVTLWMVSRATVFHLITTFRELCDHFGLKEGGVLSFTRDVVRCSPWYGLVHPRNNGYHLTHHLLPAVPYYNLPAAQALFRTMPMYRRQGSELDSYVLGSRPVVRGWHTRG